MNISGFTPQSQGRWWQSASSGSFDKDFWGLDWYCVTDSGCYLVLVETGMASARNGQLILTYRNVDYIIVLLAATI